MTTEYKSFRKDNLLINVYPSELEMGMAAAEFVAGKLASVMAEKGAANLILATGTSQFSFLEALKKLDIDWQFHVYKLFCFLKVTWNFHA
jgi:glucosamine-6-phosphate deaminase